MINLKTQIQNFIPFNEQEEVDKNLSLEFMNTFKDVLTRDNNFGHFSSSAIVLNKERTKLLLLHHNIFDGWIYPGGHADGELNLMEVAKREVEEETSVKARLLTPNMFGLQVLPIKGHVKRGKYVGCHAHYDVVYLFEATEGDVKIKEDENSCVKWVLIEDIKNNKIKLVDFIVPIFQKIISKLKNEKYI